MKFFVGCHKSFSDFLLDEARVQAAIKSLPDTASADCASILRTFSRSHQNALLAEGCLWLMDHTLKFNICKSRSSYYSTYSDWDTIPQFLDYACRYWAYHLRDADMDMYNDLVPLIKIFLQTHTLHWLEVLSATAGIYGHDSYPEELVFLADYMEVRLNLYIYLLRYLR